MDRDDALLRAEPGRDTHKEPGGQERGCALPALPLGRLAPPRPPDGEQRDLLLHQNQGRRVLWHDSPEPRPLGAVPIAKDSLHGPLLGRHYPLGERWTPLLESI